MRVMLVHPSALMYSEILLRLERLGLERVVAAARACGHEVRMVDLQVLSRSLRARCFVELVRTQGVLNRKHLGLRTAVGAMSIPGRNLMRGLTEFARMLWKFSRVYNADRQIADHRRPVLYELPLPTRRATTPQRQDLYIHTRPQSRRREADPEPEGV
ncbi:hypothetical protein [Streptomyces peucetius]|nr:hypothetical protein CGZ69_03640 [Streptomyces peucetius subsp. caesius ATCC 27952]